jgi:hypothetical protein
MSMKKWPFIPINLTEVLPEELVRFIQSGSAIRMNMPVAIVELRPTHSGESEPCYVPADDRWLKYSFFANTFATLSWGLACLDS